VGNGKSVGGAAVAVQRPPSASAVDTYEDQCPFANPRMPMLEDMKDLMTATFYGTSLRDVRRRRAASADERSAQETVTVA